MAQEEIHKRIKEIDKQIENLRKERKELVATCCHPNTKMVPTGLGRIKMCQDCEHYFTATDPWGGRPPI